MGYTMLSTRGKRHGIGNLVQSNGCTISQPLHEIIGEFDLIATNIDDESQLLLDRSQTKVCARLPNQSLQVTRMKAHGQDPWLMMDSLT